MPTRALAAIAVLLTAMAAPHSDASPPTVDLPRTIAPVSIPVRVEGIVWLGIRTKAFDASIRFYEETLGLKPSTSDADFRAYDLPNGDRIELFSEREAHHRHFTTGPVVGFRVASVEHARAAMERRGIHFIGPITRSNTDEWSHFRGPDGNVYEITSQRSQ